MLKLTLQNKSASIDFSKLIFGTANMGYYPQKEAFSQLDTYYELGGRTIDSARVYSLFKPEDTRSAEKAVGEWLKETGLRKEIRISTKGGHPHFDTMNVSRLSQKELEEDLSKSLYDLEVDDIDIYWLHRDDEKIPVGEIMETLHGFVKNGTVKLLGASNWTPDRVKEANDYAEKHGLTPFSALQIQWSYAVTDLKAADDKTLIIMNKEIHEKCRQYNIPVFAYESQAKGMFSKLSEMPETELPKGIQRHYLCEHLRDKNLARYEKAVQLSKKYGVSPAAISIAYITGNPLPSAAILGCSKVAQWRDSLTAADFQMDFSEFGDIY